MSDNKPDIEADIKAAEDRGESIGLMEPMTIAEGSKHTGPLLDLAMELTAASAGLKRSLPAEIATALSDLVRSMNCYYSNLIEGHDTHPVDIERALKNDYSTDPQKRNLQLEAKAHIEVQRWIDYGGITGRVTAQDTILEIHRRFGELLPDELLIVTNPDTGEQIRMVPGALRTRDVKVGRHIAISPGAIPRFLSRFDGAYKMLGRSQKLLAVAAAHHRLAWIHPFLDGNGRVIRLMSYAMLRELLDTGGIWSVARGLARSEADYKAHLMACDEPRRGDLDGRGTLSETALADFTRFFLETCLDQVRFMEELIEPERLRSRILLWAEEEIRLGNLPAKSTNVLEALLYRGSLPRGDVADIVGAGDRQARRIVSALAEYEVIVSESSRAPLKLAFPAKLASRWMPGLFPEKR
ncbi:Fic family protein [Peteryoungia aggregata LMG 23059]|uniref:Fic family protein n=1 Tax=Peteryoungia aggregata LMG 23059 TaxID=1368425 RepID=A0ABU0G9D9_9HYPH|nr:Fic family protein [Peteryoungia aggregata]MDQ0421951.1 Fic family protein [Peteryoungia aggregata LMG 23059]